MAERQNDGNTVQGMMADLRSLGSTVMVSFEDVQIECTVMDMKQSYGRWRLQITPVRGTGTQWVERSRISAVSASVEATR